MVGKTPYAHLVYYLAKGFLIMKARLCYGTDTAVGQCWKEEEILTPVQAAIEAVLIATILMQEEKPRHIFTVTKECPMIKIQAGGYFIEINLMEKDRQLCLV